MLCKSTDKLQVFNDLQTERRRHIKEPQDRVWCRKTIGNQKIQVLEKNICVCVCVTWPDYREVTFMFEGKIDKHIDVWMYNKINVETETGVL